MYTNADSLLNKMDELRRDIQAKDPDIIAITEVEPKKFRFPVTKGQNKGEHPTGERAGKDH